MIVGDNFVYIANPRTASQSIHKALRNYGDHKYLPHHAKAHEILAGYHKRTIPDWKDKFTFCFVRNPYDYWVSQYHRSDCWIHNGTTFKQMILGHDSTDSQHYYFAKDGTLLVDYLALWENLSHEFNKISKKLKIKAVLPHINKSVRTNTMDYYDVETKSHVEKQFEQDFLWWEYARNGNKKHKISCHS